MNVIKINEKNSVVAEAALARTKQELVYLIKKSFYTLLLSREYAAVNKAIVENTKEHCDMVAARFEAGQASQSDMVSLAAALASVRQAFEASENQVEAAQALLRSILFLEKDVVIDPVGTFVVDPRDLAYDQAFLQALKNRPEIKQSAARLESAQLGVAVARAGNRPTVQASWDYYTRSRLVTGTEKNWNDYNVLGVGISWPVFDGWQTKAKVEQALAAVKQAELSRQKTQNGIVFEVTTAYLDLKSAVDRIKAVEQNVWEYKDKTTVAQARYEQGLASQLDAHDALLQYVVAVFNQTQSIYDYMVAKAQFDMATGGSV